MCALLSRILLTFPSMTSLWLQSFPGKQEEQLLLAHTTEVQTEGQRGEVTSPAVHGWFIAEPLTKVC